MAKKVYDSYLKTTFYEQDGKRTIEPPLVPKTVAPKAESPKKKWWEIWK
jgi:hypothetical protein